MSSLTAASIKDGILNDAVFAGLRSTIGIIFIVHGMSKFNEGFGGFLSSMGIPAEMQIPIALAEVVPGILLTVGIFSRLSSALLAIIMLGAIFVVRGAESLTGDGGVEFDLILLASSLVIMIAGPGRMSLAHAIKKIPRCLH